MTQLPLPPRPESTRLARRVTRAWSTPLMPPRTVEVAELLTSELVTNAVVHTGQPLQFRIEVSALHVRVEVADHSRARPILRQSDPFAVGGRGVQLVDRLASDWGVVPRPDGKTVWFELRIGDER